MSMMMASYVILVEDAEHQRGELGRIALREELLVNADETLCIYRDNNQMLIKVNLVRHKKYLFSQKAVGTILEESFVPKNIVGKKKWSVRKLILYMTRIHYEEDGKGVKRKKTGRRVSTRFHRPQPSAT